ncbi:uncharacterized protein F5147DRAFT_838027 [Suillus discolor]|uniref:Uncharacterized protein n=1 Tax=Suillus discolor TaxID=1912936 RepID=A0A9P7JSQ9_9AGAM|nr:uncharacterized protein F5147DRAFT_838027 [Suillus discolor]KAG2105844.1 hypothetical protein F5147DRAFT_838027 [Suillus discolor]
MPDVFGISDLYDIANGIRSMSINNTNELEANLVMDLARVRWDIFRAEKALADCVVQEREIMANLSKHQSDVLKKKLDKADIGLGAAIPQVHRAGSICISIASKYRLINRRPPIQAPQIPPGFFDNTQLSSSQTQPTTTTPAQGTSAGATGATTMQPPPIPLWARFVLFLCCASPPHTNGH